MTSMEATREGAVFEELRPLLFSIAYRMLGSVAEAEDIVQEAFLRFHRAGEETTIESPRAVTGRHSIWAYFRHTEK